MMSDRRSIPGDGGELHTGRERREDPRYGSPQHSLRNLVAHLKADPWPMSVHNVSSSGICLAADRRLEPGTVLIIDIHDMLRDQTRTLSVRVLRVVEESENRFLISGVFTKRMTEDEIQSFVG